MNTKKITILILIIFIVLVTIFSSAYLFSDDRVVSKRTQSFPTQKTEIVNVDSYINAIEKHGTMWGYGRPFYAVSNSNAKCWTLDEEGAVLFATEYDSFDNQFTDSILIHPEFVFPNIENDKIDKVYLAQKSFYQQMEYDYNLEQDIWKDGTSKLLDLTELEKSQLQECMSTDKAVTLPCSLDDKGWKITDSKENKYLLGEENFVYVWFFRIYFNDNKTVYSEHFALCKDQQAKYYMIKKSEADNYSAKNITLIILLDSIQEKIQIQFGNTDFGTNTLLSVGRVLNDLNTSIWR